MSPTSLWKIPKLPPCVLACSYHKERPVSADLPPHLQSHAQALEVILSPFGLGAGRGRDGGGQASCPSCSLQPTTYRPPLEQTVVVLW